MAGCGTSYIPLTGRTVERSRLIASKRRHGRLRARYIPLTGRSVERSSFVASQGRHSRLGARYVPLTSSSVERSSLVTSQGRHCRLGARYVPLTSRSVERSRLVASQRRHNRLGARYVPGTGRGVERSGFIAGKSGRCRGLRCYRQVKYFESARTYLSGVRAACGVGLAIHRPSVTNASRNRGGVVCRRRPVIYSGRTGSGTTVRIRNRSYRFPLVRQRCRHRYKEWFHQQPLP